MRNLQRKALNIVTYFGGTYESAKSDDRKEFQRMINYVKRQKMHQPSLSALMTISPGQATAIYEKYIKRKGKAS